MCLYFETPLQQDFYNPPLSYTILSEINLVDVSDIFYFFFCSGEGKGESEELGGGRTIFFIENPRRGRVSRAGGGRGARGWEGVCGEFGGGG